MKQQEILSYFNLERHPFSREIQTPEVLMLPPFQTALTSLSLLFDTRGIGLFTGPSGSGKSTVLRKAASELNPGLFTPYYISHTSLATAEFYQELALAMGLSASGRRVHVFRRIKDFIVSKNRGERNHPVLFIDEAHALSADSLKELRMLLNFDYDSKHMCTIVLCGHEDLKAKLGLNVFSSLANSITYSISLSPLRAEDSMQYIEQRISACGGSPGLITKAAMNLIHDASSGIVRTVGTISWQALIKTMLSHNTQVEKEHVQMVLGR
jgi:type II secretory pathway predicted ATPase ExeA